MIFTETWHPGFQIGPCYYQWRVLLWLQGEFILQIYKRVNKNHFCHFINFHRREMIIWNVEQVLKQFYSREYFNWNCAEGFNNVQDTEGINEELLQLPWYHKIVVVVAHFCSGGIICFNMQNRLCLPWAFIFTSGRLDKTLLLRVTRLCIFQKRYNSIVIQRKQKNVFTWMF